MEANETLLNTVDVLIDQYSKNTFKNDDCPLCILYREHYSSTTCKNCPNTYFEGYMFGCDNRSNTYININYMDLSCYPRLKQFWTRFKEEIISGKTSDEAMEIIIEEFK